MRASFKLAMCMALLFPASALAAKPDGKSIERGRYLIKLGGCNDCHTAGYTQAAGTVPESQWLLGDKLGWRGPWGTTYASNLRLVFSKMSESDWVKTARTTQYRPPMPWFTLRDLSDRDLRDIYRFIVALGPAGEVSPVFVPPDQTPEGPFVQFPMPPK